MAEQALRFSKKLGQVMWQATLGFHRDQCVLRASALTLYSLLAIVPVMAMAFGIAKGFGFQKFLETELVSLFAGHEEILSKVLAFSNNLLGKTEGGLMAVLGVILLFYSLVKLMSHMEMTFNQIWQISEHRSLIRKITDYLTTSVAIGVLVLVSGGVNIFMAGQVEVVSAWLNLPADLGLITAMGGRAFSFLSIWLLFLFCYMIMPNARVNLRGAVAGSIIAGSLTQAIQMVYLKFQVGVSSYNAIYGSFAALPLFLVWMQMSWIVLLYGAQIACTWENTYDLEADQLPWENVSPRLRKILLLRLVRICVTRFAGKLPPASDLDLAKELKLPRQFVRQLLALLIRAGILFQVAPAKPRYPEPGYAPAWDIESLSIMDIISAVERDGLTEDRLEGSMEWAAFEQSLDAFDTAARGSAGERKLKDI